MQFKLKSLVLLFCFLNFAHILFSQRRVACVGNSITFGWGLRTTENYPVKLQTLLGSDYLVTNFGVSGRTLLKKGDKPYWNEAAYRNALNFNPDMVVIMLGTNDSKSINWNTHKGEFTRDYVALINSFRNLDSNPEIWICTLLPSQNSSWDISLNVINDEINPEILGIAIAQDVHMIDMAQAFKDKNNLLLSDGVHPNASGASLISEKVFNALSMDPMSHIQTQRTTHPLIYFDNEKRLFRFHETENYLKEGTLTIYNTIGKVAFLNKLSQQHTGGSLSALPSGTYIYQLSSFSKLECGSFLVR